MCIRDRNTAGRRKIPGKDGRGAEEVCAHGPARHDKPTQHADELAPSPAPERGIIGQARRVPAVRRGLAFRDRIARLSSALVAVVTRRWRPYRKNGEGLLARWAPVSYTHLTLP